MSDFMHDRRMVRRARWRPLPNDGGTRLTKLLPLAALGMVGELSLLVGEPFKPAAMLGIGILGALVAFSPARPRSRKDPSPKLAASAPWPLAPRTFPARLRYCREFDPIAQDEAMVSFGDGWMTVEGLRTSFSLRPRDAHVIHAGESGCDLLFADGTRIEIRPYNRLQVDGEDGGALRNRFEIALDLWHDGPAGEGLPVLPPDWSHAFAGEFRTALTVLTGLASTGLAILGVVWGSPSEAAGLAVLLLLGVGLASLATAVSRVRRHVAYARSLPPSLRP